MNKTASGICLIVALSLRLASAADPVVEAKDGNIVLRTPQGEVKQLTSTGHDSAPVLSPDGKWIVFIRAIKGAKISTGSGDYDPAELWQISASGKDLTRLAAPRQAEKMENVIAAYDDLQFSTDGRYVFFVSPAYATSGAVHVVDTTNSKEHFLIAGSGLEVVRSGEYKDCLLIGQHRYFLGGGSYDWIWLFRPDGKEVGPVGEDAANFKELYCPEVKKPRKAQ